MTTFRKLVRTLRWPALTLLVVIVVITALGGFDKYSPPDNDTAVGEWVTLTRWDLRVDSCEAINIEDDTFSNPQVIIHLDVVNTWTQSQIGLNWDAVIIELPSGEEFGLSRGTFYFADAENSGRFDPGFERPALLTMRPEQPINWDDHSRVRIRLATEEEVSGFVTTNRWVGIEQAAAIEVVCPVRTSI